MKFETAQIHFLSDVYPDILLPWQPDVTTSPLCAGSLIAPKQLYTERMSSRRKQQQPKIRTVKCEYSWEATCLHQNVQASITVFVQEFCLKYPAEKD